MCGAAADPSIRRRRPGRQAAEEGLALRDLGERDVLVRLVRLLDRAGAADDGRDAGLLEQPGLGAEGDLAAALAPASALASCVISASPRVVEAGNSRAAAS